MTDHEPARTTRSRAAVENDEAKAAVRSGDPVDDNSIIAAVREGAAPSYPSDALTIDENTGAPVLSSASLPQLTMPELNGLAPDDVVVPEGDPAIYGVDEDADEVPATVRAVDRAKRVAEEYLDASASEVRTGKAAAKRAAKDKEDDAKDAPKATPVHKD